MNILQRIENKHVRWFLRRNSELKYSSLKRFVRTATEYEKTKERIKNFKKENLLKGVILMDSQCEYCCYNKKGKCRRVGTNGQTGVCWMEKSEGEY